MKIFFVLLLLFLSGLALADEVLIPAGATWKYLDNGSNQGTGWRSISFDDGAWASGRSQLGYGDGDEATVIGGGPSSKRYVTTYFRKSFSITNAEAFKGYALQVKRDDGVVVYVNGTEVWRNNLPMGTIAYNTYAQAAASDDGSTFQTVNLESGVCKTGSNVVAVEIHQSSATSSDVSFDLQLTGIDEAISSLGVNEVVYQWSGAIQPTSATVVAKLTNASTSCRLVVSTSASLSSPLLSPAATASSTNNLMAKMSITGLRPNTTYYYAVQSGGLTDNSSEDVGRFRTPAAGAFSFRFTVGSCAVSSNHQVYTLMRYKAPLFHLTTGDFHYANPNSSTNVNVHRLPYEQNMLSQPPSRAFFLRTPLAYVWDDHDYSGNNSNAASAGKTNARRAYQEYVPHYPLAAGSGNVPIYQAFTLGRVRFILSDLRSERTSTAIMSTTQKNWFKKQCLYARDNRLIIAWVSVVSFGGTHADNWSGYRAERTELSNFFRDNNIRNLFILSGDAHMVAIDNGSNHDFSTGSNNPYNYPVFQAAAINNGGSTKGGTYSEGGTFPNPNLSTGQYGLVEVTDGGGSYITIKFTGYRTAGNTASESVLTSYTFSRTLSTAAALSLSARTVEPDQQVQLAWEAASTQGSYTIEHSPDGYSFSPIGTVSGTQGRFVHASPATGWNYYRLRGGSDVREQKLFMRGNLRLRLAPNPARGQVAVHLENVRGITTGRYILYNGRMRTQQQGDLTLREGENQFRLDVSELPAGEYFLHVVLQGGEVVQKLLLVQ
jgi:alkaline phosphatase D